MLTTGPEGGKLRGHRGKGKKMGKTELTQMLSSLEPTMQKGVYSAFRPWTTETHLPPSITMASSIG